MTVTVVTVGTAVRDAVAALTAAAAATVVTAVTVAADLASPPCAFADAFVCPFPPPGNALPIALEAGERAVLTS
jgi:hypothetical protein